MQKPKSVRVLAIIASICTALNIILNICVYLNPNPVINLFVYESDGLNPDIPSLAKTLLIASYLMIVPFLAVCISGAISKTIGFTKGVLSAVLAPILYCGGYIASHIFSSKAMQEAVYNGEDAIIYLNILISTENILHFLNTAALVLICCACAVEIYISRTQAMEN